MNKKQLEQFDKRFENKRTQLYEYSQRLGTYNSCGNTIKQFISTLLKAEHQRGFIEGSDITGSMGVEICACKLHDQRKKYRAKIKTLKDANKEDNMNGLRKIFELLEEILNK